MKPLAIDLAVVGKWNLSPSSRHAVDGTANGAVAVRLAYAVIEEDGSIGEHDVLILKRDPLWPSASDANEAMGGVTNAGLAAEGQHAWDVMDHPFWTLLDHADPVVSFFQQFHIGALRSFASEVGIDLEARYPRLNTFDVMLKATIPCKLPSASGGAYKPPSLIEASRMLIGRELPEERNLSFKHPQPVKAFGSVQVRAVAKLYVALTEAGVTP